MSVYLNCHCECGMVLVAVLVLVGIFAIGSVAGERTGGAFVFSAESINSGGVSFSSRDSVSLGATLGQPTSTKSRSSGGNSVLPGFWNQFSDRRKPAPTLFMFR